MPTFPYRRPSSISQSVSALLSSSPELSGRDQMAVERAAAAANRADSLNEKTRLEIEERRKAAAFREDPRNTNEFAAFRAGVPVRSAEQYGGHIRGEVLTPQVRVDEEGNEMPSVTYARPDVTPEQERSLAAAFSAAIANRLATGSTNAAQLTQAGTNSLADATRQAIAATPGAVEQNRLKASIPGTGYREPFSGQNAQGVITNQESGEARIGDRSIYDAAVEASRALGSQRRASAGLSGERATDLRETRPGRMERTEATTDLAEARAGQVGQPRPAPQRTPGQEAADLAKRDRATREVNEAKQRDAAARFRRDPEVKKDKYRGSTLGAWVEGKGFEVRDKSGKVIAYYD